LLRYAERPQTIRLEFRGDIFAEVPRAAFDRNRHVKDWILEFPSQALRVF